MRIHLTLRTVYAIIAVVVVLRVCHIPFWYAADSYSYLEAWDNHLSHGELDPCRTPIYPTLCGVLRSLFGEGYFTTALRVLQAAVFLASVVCFRRMASAVVRSEQMVLWLTLAYGVLHSTGSWLMQMLTESLALSGMVFLCYCLVSYQRSPRLLPLLGSVLWLAFLVFLRPALVFLLPVCLVTWGMFAVQRQRYALWGLVGTLAVCLGEVGYCAKFQERCGYFSPSIVSTVNLSTMAIADSLLLPSHTANPGLHHYLDSVYERGEEVMITFGPVDDYGAKTMQDALKQSMREQPREWAYATLRHMNRAFAAPYFFGGLLVRLIGPNVSTVFLLIMIYLLFHLRAMWRERRLQVIPLFLWMTLLANIITVGVAAQLEWGRLLTPTVPCFLLILGELLLTFVRPWNGRGRDGADTLPA